jgi:hypothetical protein
VAILLLRVKDLVLIIEESTTAVPSPCNNNFTFESISGGCELELELEDELEVEDELELELVDELEEFSKISIF